MPDIDSMKTSNYLKKEDVGQGVQVTIRQVIEGNIAQEGKPAEMKWLIYFNEFEKPLVSNVTHREQIASYLGSRNTDHWAGQSVVLWNDPSVLFGSNVGGIRVRPTQQPQQTQAGYAPPQAQNQAPQNQNHNPYAPKDPKSSFTPDFDDDIPDFS